MHRIRPIVALLVALALSIVSRASAADPLQVGVARIDITPTEPIRLSGYGNRRDETSDVAGKLSAKALAISDRDQPPAVLITADVIGLPASLVEELAARLAKKAGIQRPQLAVCASHTHTGPYIKGTLPFIFSAEIPPDHQLHIDRYSEKLLDELEKVALDALAAREPAYLSWSVGKVTFAANRRKLADGVWTGFGVNPDGPVDHALPVMRISDDAGKLKVVLINYACHCTTHGAGFNRIHGDWAAAAQEAIEARHPGATALVTIGCGGDQNPEPRGALDECLQHGQAIADDVDRLLEEHAYPLVSVPRGKFERIELQVVKPPSLAELQATVAAGGRNAYYAQVNVDRLARGEQLPGAFPYAIQTWNFGDTMAMVFLAGEVVVDYAIRLKSELKGQKLWINAYANDLPCYIPSKRILREGGYEADASRNFYDKPDRLVPEVEDMIVDAVIKQLPEVYRRKTEK